MSNLTNDFVRSVNNAPSVSEELASNGAYPVRTDDGWEVPLENLRPIIDSYFERTRILTGRGEIHFDGVPSYLLTNETNYPSVLSGIVNLGGAFVGVGALLSLTIPVWQGAKHAFVVDYNAAIPFGITPLLGALFAMAPTRAHFVSLILGRPIEQEVVDQTLNLNGVKISYVIQDEYSDRKFIETLEQSLAAMIGNAAERKEAYDVTRQWLRALRQNVSQIFKLSRQDYAGHGGPLANEESYNRYRDLFLENRVTGLASNLAGPEILRIEAALRAMDLPLASIYVSNTESWLSDQEDVMEPINYYRNLRRFGALGNPLIISSLYVREPMLFDLKSYLRRAVPFSVPSEVGSQIALAFRLLRYFIMRKDAKGLSMEEIFKAMKARALGTLVDSLLASVKRLDEPLPADLDITHSHLIEDNTTYRKLPKEVQRMFLLNLMDLGAVRAPYPILRNAPPLMIYRPHRIVTPSLTGIRCIRSAAPVIR